MIKVKKKLRAVAPIDPAKLKSYVERGSQIYLIRAGVSGPVKIGRAVDVRTRLAALQTAHYEELHLLRIVRADAEVAFHRRFSDLRIRGEWFQFDPEMLTFLPESDEANGAEALLEQYRRALDMVAA